MNRSVVAAFLRAMAQAIEEEGNEEQATILLFMPGDETVECYTPEGTDEEIIDLMLNDFTVVYWSPPPPEVN